MTSLRALGAITMTSLALLAAGCGGEEDDGTIPAPDGSGSAETADAGGATTAEKPAAEGDKPAATEGGKEDDLSQKPAVQIPKGEPPTKLETKDLVEGKGKPAKAGDDLSMQYVGVTYSTGEQFDASWDSGQPFEFKLGEGNVIGGWDEGIVGMKPGGRRLLTIPPDLGYGEAGSPPSIGPNETLIFIVDLLEAK